jgi:hypothetical protein
VKSITQNTRAAETIDGSLVCRRHAGVNIRSRLMPIRAELA